MKNFNQFINESFENKDDLQILREMYPEYTFNLTRNFRFKGDAWNYNLYKGDKYIFGIKGPCSYKDAIESYKNAIKREEKVD